METDLSIAVIKGLMSVADMPAAATSPANTAGSLLLTHSPLNPLSFNCRCCIVAILLRSYAAIHHLRVVPTYHPIRSDTNHSIALHSRNILRYKIPNSASPRFSDIAFLGVCNWTLQRERFTSAQQTCITRIAQIGRAERRDSYRGRMESRHMWRAMECWPVGVENDIAIAWRGHN
jgi:hypothetical protein